MCVCANLIVDKTLEKLFTWVFILISFSLLSISFCFLVGARFTCSLVGGMQSPIMFLRIFFGVPGCLCSSPPTYAAPLLILMILNSSGMNLSQAQSSPVELTITQGQDQKEHRVEEQAVGQGSWQAADRGTIAARLGAGHHLGVLGGNVLAVAGDDKLKYIADLRGWENGGKSEKSGQRLSKEKWHKIKIK